MGQWKIRNQADLATAAADVAAADAADADVAAVDVAAAGVADTDIGAASFYDCLYHLHICHRIIFGPWLMGFVVKIQSW